MVCIYKITSPSGRIYIGQTRNYHKRLKDYRKGKGKGQHKLRKSFLKYGLDAHTFEVVRFCSDHWLDAWEKYFIIKYDCITSGLNLKEGGANGRLSPESLQKMKDKLKGKPGLKGKDHPSFGKPIPEERRVRISAAHKGRKFTSEHIKNLTASLKGRKFTDAGKEACAASRRGKKRPAQSVNVRGESNPMYGTCRIGHTGKKVIDTHTGTVYLSVTQAAKALGHKQQTVSKWLNNIHPNPTSLKYI